MANEYEEYLEREWTLFAADPARRRASLVAIEGMHASRVLDVGCGAGQEMIPFASSGALCVGVDIAPASAMTGARLFAARYPRLVVTFAMGAVERLPFLSQTFDVVICRVVIPYTDNAQALHEMARVLRPGGILLLKIHHLRYYLEKFRRAVRQCNAGSAIHALRTLLSGVLYHVTGRQPSGGLLLRESFQTHWLLARELRRVGLAIERELPDSNPLTPSYRVRKRPTTSSASSR
jgi:SAM-dependent methyltransferase